MYKIKCFFQNLKRWNFHSTSTEDGFLGLLVMAVVGAGYYFKIYKKNQKESEGDEDYNEIKDDYESEDNIEKPEEMLEEEENEEADDMAIDAYE